MRKEKLSKVIDQYADYIKDGSNNWEKKNDHLMEMLLDSCEEESEPSETIEEPLIDCYWNDLPAYKLILHLIYLFHLVIMIVTSLEFSFSYSFRDFYEYTPWGMWGMGNYFSAIVMVILYGFGAVCLTFFGSAFMSLFLKNHLLSPYGNYKAFIPFYILLIPFFVIPLMG
ncbi:hypothetical protein [Psychrosphaera aestuarii]|uniref:hypothetical protein n=1 Tax=Psychrosphaera aestuarii TaxID=1266052 RepID=UPI001B32B3E3|nr:hypothetical protein [Psychrosphaera aestuarii]